MSVRLEQMDGFDAAMSGQTRRRPFGTPWDRGYCRGMHTRNLLARLGRGALDQERRGGRRVANE